MVVLCPILAEASAFLGESGHLVTKEPMFWPFFLIWGTEEAPLSACLYLYGCLLKTLRAVAIGQNHSCIKICYTGGTHDLINSYRERVSPAPIEHVVRRRRNLSRILFENTRCENGISYHGYLDGSVCDTAPLRIGDIHLWMFLGTMSSG